MRRLRQSSPCVDIRPKGGGGKETILLEASIHGGKDVVDEEAKDRATVEFDGESECGKTILPVFRPE